MSAAGARMLSEEVAMVPHLVIGHSEGSLPMMDQREMILSIYYLLRRRWVLVVGNEALPLKPLSAVGTMISHGGDPK